MGNGSHIGTQMGQHVGELAALTTAACWAISALAFEAAGKRMGSLNVNIIRLLIGSGFLVIATTVLRGMPIPTDATPHAVLWLALSGVVGFAFGDLCLFRAFVVVGPRISTLMMSAVPPLAAIFGWLLMGETLSPRDLTGMALTVTGIAWAIVDRTPGTTGARFSKVGLLLAFGGAVGQAGGLVLSKFGMGDYDPFAATQIRLYAGLASFAVIFTVTGRWSGMVRSLSNRPGLGYTTIGAFFGPFLGVSMSLLAVQHAAAGVAASIMATTPIVIIPAVILIKKERVGIGGILGAMLAVAGVSLLFN